ncbi:MAG: hypothetical protein E7376_04775 [Clostridiales bacterium]|nr:hypothetical protein [Clostridiales bacterium]
MSKYKNGKKVTLYSVIGKIGDFLLWPVMLISLFSSFFMLVQKKQNKITSVFGYSFVNVLSESMVDEGFLKNDTVITKNLNERDVRLGDIIAFYYQSSTISSTKVQMVAQYEYNGGKEVDYTKIEYGVDISNIKKINDKSDEYLAKAQEKKAKVYFHRVIGIYVDEEGNLFFKTKGSNNYSADTPLTRGDLVVGKYVNTPVVLRRAVSFCASSTGMIILVCFPLSLLVLMQCFSLIEQVAVIQTEKKLITGKVSFFDESIQKDFSGSHMEIYNKVYFYHITPSENKQTVKEYLWKDILTNFDLPPKKREEYNILMNSLKLYELSPEAYFDEWIENTQGSVQKNLIKLKEQCFQQQEVEKTETESNRDNIDQNQDIAKEQIFEKEDTQKLTENNTQEESSKKQTHKIVKVAPSLKKPNAVKKNVPKKSNK